MKGNQINDKLLFCIYDLSKHDEQIDWYITISVYRISFIQTWTDAEQMNEKHNK